MAKKKETTKRTKTTKKKTTKGIKSVTLVREIEVEGLQGFFVDIHEICLLLKSIDKRITDVSETSAELTVRLAKLQEQPEHIDAIFGRGGRVKKINLARKKQPTGKKKDASVKNRKIKTPKK